MEAKILEIIRKKDLPDYIFEYNYSGFYFFEMPLIQKQIEKIIVILERITNSTHYFGILIDPDNPKKDSDIIFNSKITDIEEFIFNKNNDFIFEYSKGYFNGYSKWELYYSLHDELLIVGINDQNKKFKKEVRNNKILDSRNYELNDIIYNFKSINTSGFTRPVDEDYEKYLMELYKNYSG